MSKQCDFCGAKDKGYHKFFCIRVSTSELKLKCSDNLDITMITPTEDTGNCAMFNANNIRHLIELGRKDALAFLKTLKGDSYEKIEFFVSTLSILQRIG